MLPGPELSLRRASPALTLAVGILIGVLFAVIALPDRSSLTTNAASRRGGDTSVAGSTLDTTGDASLATGGALNTAGGATTSTGPRATTGAPTTDKRDAAPPAQRGVDAKTIKIGVALPDISVIAALGPGYNQGDVRAHVESILDALHREHQLPVAGRDFEVVYRTFNILSADAEQATCTGFAQDDHVFAVIGIHDYPDGAECLATQYKIPVITSDGPYEGAYVRGWPWLFTLEMSQSRVLRNLIAWGDVTGRFKGKKIGVYYPDDPSTTPDMQKYVINRLRQRGYNVASIVTTSLSAAATGGPNDTVAVERFRAAGVDTALLFVSPVAKTNFFTQARQQGYKPAFLESDVAFSTTTTGTTTYPADYFDGTWGVTGQHFGEAPAGIPETPEAQKCGADFTAKTGQHVDRQKQEAEYIAGNQACDEFRVFMTALNWAGRNLTPLRLVQGLETIKGMRMGIHGDVSFNPQRHDGVETYRELLWKASCKCWVAQGDLKPAAQ
ncbi:MAG TPA: ABC transporter substrate-binding protein [Acidimicrobiales bacterium]|nr:ABC transporter substrate-binding protein [Acidimicrobiales bacterium]